MEGPRKIPEVEWNIHKERLRSLYVTENTTLEQVIETLRSDHGFLASKAQYIRKFKKWGFQKNAKSDIWKGVVCEVRKRKLESKDSEVYIKGNRVPAKKIRKEMSRYASIVGDQTASRAADTIVRTPQAEALQFVDYEHIPWFQFQTLVEPYFEYIHNLEFMDPLSSIFVESADTFLQNEARGNLLRGADPQSYFNSERWLVDSQMDIGHFPNDNQGFSHEPMLHMDLRDVQALTSTADKNRREVLSLLGQCTDDSENLDQESSYEQMATQLDKILPERYDGEHAEYAERFKGLSPLEPAFQLLRLSIHLSSNNSLSVEKTDKLTKWINQTGAQRVLERLLDLKTPTIEVFGRNVLQSAARLGFRDIVQILIQKGVNVNGVTHCMFKRTTALEEAVSNDRFHCVQTLLDAGANPRQFSDPESSLLHEALKNSREPVEMLRILIEAGADVNPRSTGRSSQGTPILLQAASACDLSAGQLLIAAKAHVNDMSSDSLTALQTSAKIGDVEFTELLIEAGADVNAPAGEAYSDVHDTAMVAERPDRLSTPIQRTSDGNHTEIVVLLIRKGADVNACPWEEHIDEINSEHYLEAEELRTALQAAVYYDNFTMIHTLLMAGAEVNAPGCPFTALQIAVRGWNIRTLRLLLKEGADVNAPASTGFGMTALQMAASEGSCEMVNALLAAGADINAPPSKRGATALQAASGLDDPRIAKILIRAGADVNANPSPYNGRTCLQNAAESGGIDLVSYLLLKGANVNSPGAAASGGMTALQAALSCSWDRSRPEDPGLEEHDTGARIFRKLLEAGANINTRSSSLSTWEAVVQNCCPAFLESIILERLDANATLKSDSSLVLAVIQKSTETISLLIKAGADINGRRESTHDSFGKYGIDGGSNAKTLTPLEAAVAVNSIPLTRLLIDLGAKPDGFDESLDFWTPLHWAIKQNSIDLVNILLEAGANSNAIARSCKCHQTPLQEVLLRPSINTDMLSILIDAGADPNKLVDQSPQLPLRSAADRECFESVRRLLGAGARVEGVSEDHTTALQAAVSLRNRDILQLLIDAGANVNAPAGPKFGRTALQKAAEKGDVSLVQYLLLHHADVNAPAGHSEGVTALQGAAIGGHLKIVLMLLRAGAQINAPPAEVKGRFALDGAAEHGRLDTVVLLLNNDHEEAGKDLRYYRAAEFAVSNGHNVIGRILKEHAAAGNKSAM